MLSFLTINVERKIQANRFHIVHIFIRITTMVVRLFFEWIVWTKEVDYAVAFIMTKMPPI